MIYFIADTHFSDASIMRYENRPFRDVQEMNENIIKNWNEVVAQTDEVYMLGDFGASGQEIEVLSKLNGAKYLVKGNHDTASNEYYRSVGFAEVYDKPIILENFWILSHEPLYVCENMPYANIFGHVHNSPLYKTFSKQHYCVSVERIEYTPISFETIMHKVKKGQGNAVTSFEG